MSARDIAASKVMQGDTIAHPDGEWSRVAAVERDGEFVVLRFDDDAEWRVHPMRRVSVNRKEDRE